MSLEAMLMNGTAAASDILYLATETGLVKMDPADPLNPVHITDTNTLAVCPSWDGSFVVAAAANKVSVYSVASGALLAEVANTTLSNSTAIPHTINISRNNKFISVSCRDSSSAGRGRLFVYRYEGGVLAVQLALSFGTTGLSGPGDFSPDSRYLYCPTTDIWGGDLQKIDLENNNQTVATTNLGNIYAIGQVVVNPATGDVLFGKAGQSSTSSRVHAYTEDFVLRYTIIVSGSNGAVQNLRLLGSPDNPEAAFLYTGGTYALIRLIRNSQHLIPNPPGYDLLPTARVVASAPSGNFLVWRSSSVSGNCRLYLGKPEPRYTDTGLPYFLNEDLYVVIPEFIDARFVGGM